MQHFEGGTAWQSATALQLFIRLRMATDVQLSVQLKVGRSALSINTEMHKLDLCSPRQWQI